MADLNLEADKPFIITVKGVAELDMGHDHFCVRVKTHSGAPHLPRGMKPGDEITISFGGATGKGRIVAASPLPDGQEIVIDCLAEMHDG